MQRSAFIEIYLPQVIEISKLYTGQGVYIEDLVGEGNLALAQGVTMLGCLEHAKEAEGMLMKMVMDAMEELIQEDLTEKDIVKKAIDQEKKKNTIMILCRPIQIRAKIRLSNRLVCTRKLGE